MNFRLGMSSLGGMRRLAPRTMDIPPHEANNENAASPLPPPDNPPPPPPPPDAANNDVDTISPAALLLCAAQQQQRRRQPRRGDGCSGGGPSSMSPDHHHDGQHLTWSRVSLPPGSVVPPRRSGAASVVVKGKLYMFGVSSAACVRA